MQPTDCNVLSSCYLSLHIPGCDRPMLARESLGYDINGHIVAPSWLPRAPRLATWHEYQRQHGGRLTVQD